MIPGNHSPPAPLTRIQTRYSRPPPMTAQDTTLWPSLFPILNTNLVRCPSLAWPATSLPLYTNVVRRPSPAWPATSLPLNTNINCCPSPACQVTPIPSRALTPELFPLAKPKVSHSRSPSMYPVPTEAAITQIPSPDLTPPPQAC